MAAGNAGMGRPKGSPNRRTLVLMELAEEGETPCAFALRVMRDETQPPDIRLHAAKLAAPFVHPKPQPEPRMVSFELPELVGSAADIIAIHARLMSAVAAGEVALEEARDISTMLETHRKVIETADLEQRVSALEKTGS